MHISDILTPERTRLDVRAASKKRVLETIAELIAASHPDLEVGVLGTADLAFGWFIEHVVLP